MSWIRKKQVTGVVQIAILLSASALLLVSLTWYSLNIVSAYQGKDLVIHTIFSYLPLTLIPLGVGFLTGLFMLREKTYKVSYSAAGAYLLLVAIETVRAISASDTAALGKTWLLTIPLIAIVGAIMILGFLITKKVINIDATDTTKPGDKNGIQSVNPQTDREGPQSQ